MSLIYNTLISLERIGTDGILAEKDLVPVIAEIGEALTALVLFERDSQKLAKHDDKDENTMELGINPNAQCIKRIISEREELTGIQHMLSTEYYEQLSGIKSIKHLTISKVVESVAASWDRTMSKSSLSKELMNDWHTAYACLKEEAGTRGRFPFYRLVKELIRVMRPSLPQVLLSLEQMKQTKQTSDCLNFMRKLDNERVKHNLVCKFFGCTNWILEDSLTLSIFYNGLDSDNKAFVFERVVPDICKTRGKHPTQVSWMDITLVLDSYSLDHLVASAHTVRLNRMVTKSAKQKKQGTKTKGSLVPTGVTKEEFFSWTTGHPGKCFFYLKPGHVS